MGITIATYGFFLFPVRQGLCEAIAAPAIRKGDLEHVCRMFIHGQWSNWEIEGVAPSNTLTVSDTTISVGGRAGATLCNFDLVVNFGALSCGSRLKGDWESDDMEDVNVVVEPSRGELTAFADNYTNEKAWQWTDCNAAPVIGQFSSLVVYQQPQWTGVLEFTRRRNGGTHGRIEFTSDVVIAVSHLSKHAQAAGEEGERKVDEAHASATRKLCQPKGGELTRPAPTARLKEWPHATLPEPVRDFLDLGKKTAAVEARVTAKGRPNCGARLIYF